VGSANTLVRTPTGWLADNTDIDGVVGALGAERPSSGMVLGSGGTAPAAVMGLAAVGAERITVVARNAAKAEPLLELVAGAGADGVFCAIDGSELAGAVADTDVVVSTVPADAAAPYAPTLAGAPLLLDAIYDPWPTPLASAVSRAGGRVISGLQMLLHQAFTQVELFTGRPAPRDVMAAALS
jgi:shikimate dehydrogenase